MVLIHEIGHSLGLQHSNDKNSIMYPIFERDVGEQLPVISNDDVERLRLLYDPVTDINLNNQTIINENTTLTPLEVEKCPSTLWSITQSKHFLDT